MTRLSSENLPSSIRTYSYDRDAVTIGIVHFGIGNFHRAHQAVYCDDLLEHGATQWGIAGVSLRSSKMKEALAPQDYVYTLATLSEASEYRVIGALKDIYVAPENPEAVISILSKPSTQLVSSTITEKGYCLGPNGIDFKRIDLQADLNSLENPKTIYGFLARGLMLRQQTNSPSSKLTIMCCDNISGGGELLKSGVERLLKSHAPKTLEWSHGNVSFISSMVDRVSPATDDRLRDLVQKASGCVEASPVSTEPFSQWIIEDNFAGERPDFNTVGAEFVTDIAPFEKMKLGYLNAAHTFVSTLGYLFTDKFVHESLDRPAIEKFVRGALYKNILPHASVPSTYDGSAYIEAVIQRFENKSLPYENLQVGTDSSQKIQQRWFPTLDQGLRQKSDMSFFGFALGAWCNFIQTALQADVLNDPRRDSLSQIEMGPIQESTLEYLKIANAEKFNFFKNQTFMSTVTHYAQDIHTHGVEKALDRFLTS